jgi:hypothetical protein
MKESDALRILNVTAEKPRKIEAFQKLADRLGIPQATVYHWWYVSKIPRSRLSVFDLLKVRK